MFIGVRGRALTSLLSATYRPLRGLAECTKDATTSVGSLMCCIDMLSLPFLPLYFFCRPPLSPSQPLDTSVSSFRAVLRTFLSLLHPKWLF